VTILQAANILGDTVELTPARGWIQKEARPPAGLPTTLPTIAYEPADGRNASVLLTLFPNDVSKVSDPASLKKFHQLVAAPMAAGQTTAPKGTEFKLANGYGVYASFEDPDLVGKPPQKGNYKFATPVCAAVGESFTLFATILTDSTNSPDFKDALQIVQSAKLAARATAPSSEKTTDAQTISIAGRDAVLHLPAGRFAKPGPPGNSSPSYFSRSDVSGMLLSGWLEPSSRYGGFAKLWASDKPAMEKGMGVKLQGEVMKTFSDWEAVEYSIPIGDGVSSKNIRACRVVGKTWADVHLSFTSKGDSWDELEAVMKALSLEKK
jgi:hypothetical protein